MGWKGVLNEKIRVICQIAVICINYAASYWFICLQSLFFKSKYTTSDR